ncbi:MAG: endonuclease domain-containing protein [Xanthomonadales bacterium]|nr:endonuclease domain-containing protein [Xanthomonadales bacterium]ODU93516.1 MAG: hypothetical protein ABT18_07355 [Rhodanobacter sp. SCN 66-43]OJY86612.1 MAG: hypothetical protein BGP23_03215 [Xanthomonadales bacterium 66-474]
MREGAKTSFARRLRRDMTDAERRLWHHLRRRQLLGYRFRRQFPIGPYIVDFACIETKLIIEVDGGQHFDATGDVARTQRLHELGYRVLRFWNNDVLTRTHQVLAVIYEALGTAGPHPGLPPQAGEGDKP